MLLLSHFIDKETERSDSMSNDLVYDSYCAKFIVTDFSSLGNERTRDGLSIQGNIAQQRGTETQTT